MSQASTSADSDDRKEHCLQKFDLYANPVTLTYNKQKDFTTVHGGICTLISTIILIYYVSAAVVQNVVNPEYV